MSWAAFSVKYFIQEDKTAGKNESSLYKELVHLVRSQRRRDWEKDWESKPPQAVLLWDLMSDCMFGARTAGLFVFDPPPGIQANLSQWSIWGTLSGTPWATLSSEIRPWWRQCWSHLAFFPDLQLMQVLSVIGLLYICRVTVAPSFNQRSWIQQRTPCTASEKNKSDEYYSRVQFLTERLYFSARLRCAI